MRYTQAFANMQESMKQHFDRQDWAFSLLEQGADYADLLSSKRAMACLQLILSEREQWVLQLIFKKVGSSVFTLELLEKYAAPSKSGAEVRVALLSLRRYGIILAFRKSWGELVYALPEEGFTVWQALLFGGPVCKPSNEAPLLEERMVPSGSRGIAQEFFGLVTFAAHHGLFLTAKGTLHKKQLTKLMDRLRIPNMAGQLTHLSAFSAVASEWGVALLLDFAMRLGILQQFDHQWELNRAAWSNWLRLTFNQQQTVLYTLWKGLHTEPPLWLQHGISMFDHLSSEQWCSLGEIISWFERQQISLSPVDSADFKELLLKQWLVPLHAFGWLEWGTDGDGEEWFRLLIDPRADFQTEEPLIPAVSNSFYVQPDFELLLPPNVPLSIEWEVTFFADPVNLDEVRVYRISRQSIQRGLDSGRSIHLIIKFLVEHAVYGVPSGLEIALKEWDEQYGKLQFMEVTLLHTRSAETAKAIRKSDSCRPFIESEIGDSDFIVKKQQIADFHKLLTQMGYHPQFLHASEVNENSHQLKRQDEEESSYKLPPQETIYKKAGNEQAGHHLQYELAASLPDVTDLYPDLEEIPTLWLKEYGEYHGSTRKDMIRKAIELKSYLKLRKEGIERRIWPQRLQEDRSGWMLFGLENTEEIILQSEDWKEMKLLLPGVNDP